MLAPVMEPLDAENNDPINKQVYQALRQAFMSGAVVPGARLSSRSIAAALGVSQMPVREALKLLDADGVVVSSVKKAFVVRELTRKKYQEIVKIRLKLEGLVVREAVLKNSNTEVARVRWLIERMKGSRDWRSVLDYNYQLHFLIYRQAEMPYATAIIENIWLQVGPALHMVNEALPIEIAFENLDALCLALEDNDPDRAVEALRNDIKVYAEALMERLS